MRVTVAFCVICRREVHLADGESLTCPVCSSPLAEKNQAGPASQPSEVLLG